MEDINIKDLLKDQLLILLIPIVLGVVLVMFTINLGARLFSSANTYTKQISQEKTLVADRDNLKKQLEQQTEEDSDPDLKKILTIEGKNFGVDASFAPLFDNMLTIAKESGIRIRSVDYNFSPAEDPIFKAKIDGYNVCELNATVVGKYSEIQTFLKTMLNEDYLISLAETEIVSWRRDKTVLIANLKIRFYTNTKGADASSSKPTSDEGRE